MKIEKEFDVENPTENTSLTNNQTSSWFGRNVCCCPNSIGLCSFTNGQCICIWTSVALIFAGTASVSIAASQTFEYGTNNLPLYISAGIELTLGLFGLRYISHVPCSGS